MRLLDRGRGDDLDAGSARDPEGLEEAGGFGSEASGGGHTDDRCYAGGWGIYSGGE